MANGELFQIFAGDYVLLSTVGVNALGNDAVRDAVEVSLQFRTELHEFRPEGLIDEAAGHSSHDGVSSLAAVSVGANGVTSEERDEEFF